MPSSRASPWETQGHSDTHGLGWTLGTAGEAWGWGSHRAQTRCGGGEGRFIPFCVLPVRTRW